jgi:hypothetical protein
MSRLEFSNKLIDFLIVLIAQREKRLSQQGGFSCMKESMAFPRANLTV